MSLPRNRPRSKPPAGFWLEKGGVDDAATAIPRPAEAAPAAAENAESADSPRPPLSGRCAARRARAVRRLGRSAGSLRSALAFPASFPVSLRHSNNWDRKLERAWLSPFCLFGEYCKNSPPICTILISRQRFKRKRHEPSSSRDHSGYRRRG